MKVNFFNNNNEKNNCEIDNSSNFKSRNLSDDKSDYKYANKIGDNESFLKQDGTRIVQKKTKEVSKLVTAFATIISAAIIGIAGVGNIFGTQTAKAEILELSASVNEVYYAVELQDMDEKYDYYIVLYNDFTNRIEEITDNAYQGYFENLQTGMTYTLAVKQGNTTIASKKVRTIERESYQSDYDKPQSDNEPVIEDDDPTTGRDNTNGNNG